MGDGVYTELMGDCTGGSQVASGLITVGDLTSLLMYTAYVGGSLQMLT
jgi:putative ABC transport system ATP-binding protein